MLPNKKKSSDLSDAIKLESDHLVDSGLIASALLGNFYAPATPKEIISMYYAAPLLFLQEKKAYIKIAFLLTAIATAYILY